MSNLNPIRKRHGLAWDETAFGTDRRIVRKAERNERAFVKNLLEIDADARRLQEMRAKRAKREAATAARAAKKQQEAAK